MPHAIIKKAFILWKRFPNQLVGYKNTARKHLEENNGTYSYGRSFESEIFGNSIVLPSGLFYHREMLELYMSESVRRSREIVDENNNCDDILFNFVAANHTHSPPLFLGANIRN